MYDLVAGTASSGPAWVTMAMSAASASGEPSTLMTAIVAAPPALAHSRVSRISCVEPDWLTPMAMVSERSSRAPYSVATDGAARLAGQWACTSDR